jgi:hypothetical protein
VLLDRNGKAVAAIVGVGGFLGMGEHEVALNWNALHITDNGRNVRVDFTKEQLKAMPEYKFSSATRKGTAFYDENYRVSQNAPAMNAPPSTRSDARTGTTYGNWTALGPAGEIRASKLTGTDVKNAVGDKIGDIDEVVIGSNGRPQLVLSVGGFLGIGERRVALDWNKVQISRDNSGDLQARLDMTKEQLQAMPEFKFDAASR